MIYRGYSVLTTAPNTREEVEDSYGGTLSALDPGLGRQDVRPLSEVPRHASPYLWTAIGRPAIAQLEDWLDERKGRAVPFWLPSGRRDLSLAQAVVSGDPGISIRDCQYADRLFPHRAYRHLAFWQGGDQFLLREVLAASRAGGTESLTLDAALGVAFPASGLVCFLRLVRLASDDVELVYLTDEKAEATLSLINLPAETP